MKKNLLLFLVLFCFGESFAYSPLSKVQHQQIDMQLSGFSHLSKQEKAENADFFLRLAQKSLSIRQAIQGGTGKIPGTKLTSADQILITQRISSILSHPLSEQEKMLQELKETQLMAYELGRSLQIESLSTFQSYAITKLPTPLYRLNKNDIDINKILGGAGSTGLKLDQQNLIRELAVVLPQDTVLSIISEHKIGGFTYYQVRNREFDAGAGAKYGYFIDARFVEKKENKPEELLIPLPEKSTILKNLLQTKGSSYVWGGSWYQGLTQMESFFPSASKLSLDHQKQKNMQGVDCSGLLWQATKGNSPRNTRQLLSFGESVEIEGKTLDQIIKIVKPLDIIVWDGHIVIVLNPAETIESRRRANFKGGVEIVNIRTRLAEIMKTRKPVNDYAKSSLAKSKKFVIRRWYPSN